MILGWVEAGITRTWHRSKCRRRTHSLAEARAIALRFSLVRTGSMPSLWGRSLPLFCSTQSFPTGVELSARWLLLVSSVHTFLLRATSTCPFVVACHAREPRLPVSSQPALRNESSPSESALAYQHHFVEVGIAACKLKACRLASSVNSDRLVVPSKLLDTHSLFHWSQTSSMTLYSCWPFDSSVSLLGSLCKQPDLRSSWPRFESKASRPLLHTYSTPRGRTTGPAPTSQHKFHGLSEHHQCA